MSPRKPGYSRLVVRPILEAMNKRIHERNWMHCSGHIRRDNDPDHHPYVFSCRINDVSPVGIGLRSQQEFQPGDQVVLRIAAPGWRGFPIPGQVVRCCAGKDGYFDVGVIMATPAA